MNYKLLTNYKSLYETAVVSLKEYLINNKISSLVIGISGGIDSTITSIIANEACKDFPGIIVIGRSLPMSQTKYDEVERAAATGKEFCDDFEVFSLEHAFQNLVQNLEIPNFSNLFEHKIRLGNIRARIRMIQLYHLAHRNRGIVLSTDNLTEYYLGFWTINGDVGDFGPIQNLWKTEVYGVAEYLYNKYSKINEIGKANAILDCITAIPTDGLGITESDLVQIGTETYAEADNILIDYLSGNFSNISENHPVIERHNNTHFKRNIPISIPREIFMKAGIM